MNLLCDAADSMLLIVDPQERLMPAIDDADEVIRRCVQLATAARQLQVHVVGTEQNPAGLGPMVAAVRPLCDTVLSKFHFSAAAEPGFLERLPQGRTLIVAGCEAHVCVLQTAVGLLAAGHPVKWVSDAVGSRSAGDRATATARARAAGADVVTTEMVVFEWMRTSQHPAFRTLSKLIR